MIDRSFLKESGLDAVMLIELGNKGVMAGILLGDVLDYRDGDRDGVVTAFPSGGRKGMSWFSAHRWRGH